MIQQYDFTDKIVWVTGAGRGIGYACACSFTELGAKVIGLDCQFDDMQYPFQICLVDLSKPQQIKQVCQSLLKEEAQLDILINSAGVLKLGKLETLSLSDWQSCFDVNVNSVFHLLQQVIPIFKQQKKGVIVNVASNAARVPRINMGGYCASKAALQSLSHCLALELAEYGVRCNLVSPGSTSTQMLQQLLTTPEAIKQTIAGSLQTFKNGIPLGKLADAQEVANSVVFLASDLASHITLQNLVVDGGATLSS